MALEKMMVCADLGGSLKDKLVLGLFGLVAPEKDHSPRHLWRIFSAAMPRFWLKPKKLNGLRLLIQPTDWSQTVIFDEVFLQCGYDLTKVKFTPDYIFDCGAHIGLFSLLASSRFPNSKLIAYEPNPRNIELIRRQIAGNHLNMKLVECAVSTEAKEVYFQAANSHAGRILNGKVYDGAYKVQVIDFPEAFKQAQPKSVLLKMDIEGEEVKTLPALMPLLPRQAALFFETHAGEAGWREIEALLVANGFKVEQINARGDFCDGFASRD